MSDWLHVAGDAAPTPSTDCVDAPVPEAAFDGFSFLMPEGWNP